MDKPDKPWRPEGYIEQDFQQLQTYSCLGCIMLAIPIGIMYFVFVLATSK